MDYEKFIFIAAMTNSGSTLLQSILKSSPNIIGHSTEGIKLLYRHSTKIYPDPGRLGHPRAYTEILDIIRSDNSFDWPMIKKIWFDEWQNSLKSKTIKDRENLYFLEKTPMNVAICDILEREFLNSRFILMVRNPYAVCQGIVQQVRKNKPMNKMTYTRAAIHWAKCSELHIKNIETLKNKLFFTYEDLCEKQDEIKQKLEEFIPGSIFEMNNKFHSTKDGRNIVDNIKNLNDEKINKLSKENIDEINNALNNYKHVVEYFKYNFI